MLYVFRAFAEGVLLIVLTNINRISENVIDKLATTACDVGVSVTFAAEGDATEITVRPARDAPFPEVTAIIVFVGETTTVATVFEATQVCHVLFIDVGVVTGWLSGGLIMHALKTGRALEVVCALVRTHRAANILVSRFMH